MFKHPSQVCMTYYQHLLFALEMSYHLGMGAVKSLVHAFLPDYYISSTTDTLSHVQLRLSQSGCKGVHRHTASVSRR